MQADNRPLYIFDLDGTMALIDHRRHLVEGKETCPECKGSCFDPVTSDMCNHPCAMCNGSGKVKKKPDWKSFYEECHLDAPNGPVIQTFKQLYLIGAEIKIWSGREDSVKGKTVQWLYLHTGIQPHMIGQMLTMRPEGDYTPDEQLKRKWLNKLHPLERHRLTAVFDDRDKVVKMWRAEGVACFQVAPGAF